MYFKIKMVGNSQVSGPRIHKIPGSGIKNYNFHSSLRGALKHLTKGVECVISWIFSSKNALSTPRLNRVIGNQMPYPQSISLLFFVRTAFKAVLPCSAHRHNASSIASPQFEASHCNRWLCHTTSSSINAKAQIGHGFSSVIHSHHMASPSP